MNIGGGGEPGEEDSILHEEAGPVVALPSQPKNQVKRALYVCNTYVHTSYTALRHNIQNFQHK